MKKIHNTDICIRKSRDPYGWMGNMAGGYDIPYETFLYQNEPARSFKVSSEAIFQSIRLKNGVDREKVLSADNGYLSKKVYKDLVESGSPLSFQPLSRHDLRNMIHCIALKLIHNPELKKLLIETEDRYIVEDVSTRSHGSNLFWGASQSGDYWIGANMLGVIWMIFRNILLVKSDLDKNELITLAKMELDLYCKYVSDMYTYYVS